MKDVSNEMVDSLIAAAERQGKREQLCRAVMTCIVCRAQASIIGLCVSGTKIAPYGLCELHPPDGPDAAMARDRVELWIDQEADAHFAAIGVARA